MSVVVVAVVIIAAVQQIGGVEFIQTIVGFGCCFGLIGTL
jgi:hypothetical protein